MDQFTAEDLISIIRTRAGLSSVETEGTTDTDLLEYLHTEALSLHGEIASIHEEYGIVTERISLVSGKQKYRIPHRALFGKVRDVIGLDSTNNYYTIDRLPRENLDQIVANTSLKRPLGFYVEGNYLVLWPSLNSVDGYFEISYVFRPGKLVKSIDCRKVLSLGPGVGQLTLESAVPVSWTISQKYDIHSCLSGSEMKAWSLISSLIASDKMTFSVSDINGSIAGRFPVEVGDWVCLEETAALPGLPRELHPILAQYVICNILKGKSREQYVIERGELDRAQQRMKVYLAQRVEGRAEQISVRCFFGS